MKNNQVKTEDRAKQLWATADARRLAALDAGDFAEADRAKKAMRRASRKINVSWWRGEREVAWGW